VVEADIAAPAKRRRWSFRVGVIAAVLQAVSLLVVAVPGLIVSYGFCDPSGDPQAGYCGVRGPRWFAWVALQLILVLAIPLVLATVLRSRKSEASRRQLVAIEGVVVVVGLAVLALAGANGVTPADFIVSVGLVLLLGAIVALSVRTRRTA
jgi:quinol-cytochrome oxidoreductase complex cytochrome b subunit